MDEVDFYAEGFGAWIRPYQVEVKPGEQVALEVEVRNPFSIEETLTVELIIPPAWKVDQPVQRIQLSPKTLGCVTFQLQVDNTLVRRARIAADLTVGTRRFGQQAEALVTIKE